MTDNPHTDSPEKATSVNREEKLNLLRANIDYVETLIGHEISLIGNRMTWFAISQSFLFGAFATITTDPTRLDRAFPAGANPTTQPFVGSNTITIALLILPGIGFVFAIVAFFSVRAAGNVLACLQTVRGRLAIELNQKLKSRKMSELPILGDSNQRSASDKSLSWTIFCGALPQWVLPGMMALVWLGAFLFRLNWQGLSLRSP